jgi:DMSO/TMAO reductase YedYZ molybdopterin-dependent catalytic subunit
MNNAPMKDFRQKFAPELQRVERRLLLRGGLSLGALTLLSGCDALSGDDTLIDRALWTMLRFNDRVQAALFNPNRLAATFSKAEITRRFKFNAYYPISKVRTVDPAAWKLEVGGQVDDDTPWTLSRLRALPQASQITRHICVEGWSQIGEWSGIKLSDFLKATGADLRAKYVGFECFDDYSSSIDMASALHPQTILALEFEDSPLTPPWGAPLRLRIPTKLGFKNPKYISAITVTNDNPGGYWEDQGYDWFSGS